MRAIAIVAALAVTVAGIAAAEDAAGFTPPFPPQTQMPSPSNPFFFLHLAKCAGTSLRYLLHNRTLGVITDSSVCIPTYTHHHHVMSLPGCDFTVANGKRPSIIAGHFLWDDYEWMCQNNPLPTGSSTGGSCSIPCFSSIRDPLERFVSLYYYMMHKDGKRVETLLQDMAPEQVVKELGEMWPIMRQVPMLAQFGNLGGHPEYLNKKWTEQPELLDDVTARTDATTVAVRNVKRCVIGDVDDDEGSAELLRYFFPWMRFEELPRINSRSGHVVIAPHLNATRVFDPLPPASQEALRARYREEFEVYEAAKQVHADQLAYVRRQTAAAR